MQKTSARRRALPILTHITLILGLAGCQGLRDEPIVDMQGVNVADYNRDLAACQLYAEQVAVGGDAARGAVAGAVVGGAVGAAADNTTTAQRAAGAGAVVGGARGAAGGIREQERVLRRCLTGRGYRVLN